MFEKNLTKSLVFQQHEALLGRLPEDHPKWSEVQRRKEKLKAGYNGEKAINYFLSLLPAKNYHIFHNIRLPIEQSFFEIDAYLLSPKTSFIIEGKNYAGTLLLDRNQLTQEVNDETKVYENPLVQVNRHKILLKYWFEKYQLPFTPSEHFVCFSNTSTTINISPGYTEAEKRVCKAADLLKKIVEFEQFYKKETVDPKTIGKIKRLILTKHIPKRIEILQTYGFDKNDIITGVKCPACKFIAMEYKRGIWECPACHFRSREAHFPAINDYFLIYKPSITNSELREFLHIPSSRSATNVFSSLGLTYEGVTRDRIYFQDPRT
ncbi:nuclease-related domain-containing protein [Bacillus sp. EB600]|uniref:nuclease-related domain-containing protein n=1 Tax=Bacillus sp. EB600 TaxID=2806345 RepID=UPI00210D2551|nr:nuclease-related domain-containing protein [Bacillus sp. EB600]MCQ6281139.1 NERD domain-containing protein [Bacillus sp. EB600]